MHHNSNSCAKCGQLLPTGSAQGQCPQCLLKAVREPLELPTEALLEDHDETGQDTVTLKVPTGISASAMSGAMIGRYKLLQELGEGGFGIVYLAQQTEPVKRRVALKVIKPGMDSREIVARFEAERQALALMDHPNIAKIHDGGTTAEGRPYFVMELVKGAPVTEYCDDAKLSTRQRMELFLDVLAAVQHAHQKGIIHRDLKPSNILVSSHDGKPVLKVIDFGIAKALSVELTAKTLFTGLGRMIGTPEYMSPEQAEVNALDVDTRSDLYSLGVVLYEMLTGRTPLDSRRMRQAGYEEIQRMIREEEPPRPSTRLSTLGEALPTIARKRGTEPVKLTRQLRGELDWIVMKALEKERSRRYETASAFADDIRRHLNDEPVSASPPSRLYRLRKLARRNKQAILLAVAVGTALAVGTVVSLWQASLARQARDAAVMAKNHASEENSSRKRQLAEAARTDRLTAMELFGQNRHRDAFAFLARACDYDPESTLAAETAILQLNTLSLAREVLVLKGEGEFPIEPLNRNGWLQRLEQHQWLGADDAAFTPEGRHIFSVQTMPQAFGEGAVPSPFAHLWDANTGRLQESLALKAADRTGFNEKPASVAMSIGTLAFDWPWESNAVRDTAMPSPDGSRSVITQNGTAVLRDVAGKEGRSLDGHEGEVLCARFSSDGLALVTGGTDQNALLHDVETEEVRAWIIGHAGPVTQARFSRDGAKMVTCSEDTTARIWETAATRLMVQAGDIGEDSLMDVGFSASGRDIIARTFGQKFWTWSLETGEASGPPVYFENHEIVGEVNFNHPMALVCRPQDTKTDAEANTAEVMDLATQQSLAKLQGHAGPVQRAVFSANGQWVATQAQDRIVRVWEIRTGRQVFQTPTECSELGCLLFSPDSTRLLVPDKNHLRLLEVPSGRVLFESSLDENEEVVSAAFSPDGTLLAAGSNDSVARVWEHASGRLAATLKDHPQTVSSVTFSPDGTMLATACWRESVVQIWNTSNWQRLSLISKPGESLERVILSPDGRFVTAASDRAAALNLWEARTGELVTSLRWPEMDLRSIAFSPDGRRVITASRRGGPLIWELPGFQGPVPAWFADFLRFLVRREVAQNGRPRNLGPDTAESLRQGIEDACREDDSRFGEIARWFLTPAEQRPVRPGGKDTRHAVADRLITAEAGPVQLRQALQYDPGNPLAHYALARHTEDQSIAEFLRGWAVEHLPSPIPVDLQTRLDSLHVTEVEHSLDVPAFTHSPDGKLGVTVPNLAEFDDSQHQNKLVEVATRRVLAVILTSPGMEKMNHGGAYAK